MAAITTTNPSARITTILASAIALSIGWGIRGNFGHEYGAMMPGCLAAMVVCLMSGREDWRNRVVYFAFFGALGWAFGASISYMQVISYTHSGHLPSQFWGFGGLFLIGFVWAGMGGAGTAFPAVVSDQFLTRIFKPLCWVFVFFAVYKYWGEETIIRVASIENWTASRHESPFYWFDTDWLQASVAAGALLLYDLWNRRNENGRMTIASAIFGALTGYVFVSFLQWIVSNSSSFLPAWAACLLALIAIFIGTLANPSKRSGHLIVAGIVLLLVAVLFAHGIFRLLDILPSWPVLYVFVLLVSVLLYDCWNRDFVNFPGLVTFSAVGTIAGAILIWLLSAVNLLAPIAELLTRSVADPTLFTKAFEHGLRDEGVSDSERILLAPYQGSLKAFRDNPPEGWTETDPEFTSAEALFTRVRELGIAHTSFTEQQHELLLQYHGDLDAFLEDTFVNWPQIVTDNRYVQEKIGWILGWLGGIALYYALYGKFQNGAKLLLYMSLGWLIGFLLLPVLLGVRLTPPRSDDWAGILGVWIATMIYLIRNNLAPIAYASTVCGTIGGLAFSGTAFLKLVMVRPGNPQLTGDAEVVSAWSHWQSANWHSWLEQTYGFFNGIGVAIALALIARKVAPVCSEPKSRRWTEVFAAAFVVFGLTYLNWFKNVANWIEHNAVEAIMAMPLISGVEHSAEWWFNVVYGAVAIGGILLMIRHLTRPLPFIPSTALGKGQLLFLVFLWTVVLYNLDRAIPTFVAQRLLTEAVIILNAILVSMLVLLFSREKDTKAHVPALTKPVPYGRALLLALTALVAGVLVETAGTRAIYGDSFASHAGRNGNPQRRFGPDAEWRIVPLAKTKSHN
ncbi:MAG: hypothetical protein AMXMBFR84_49150 [Candidatus Hydrogenedentota bacterium]